MAYGSLGSWVAADFFGGVPERSKGADCKSAGSAFGGSNPPPSTIDTLDVRSMRV